jgi:AraC family transcriptional activator of pobA
MTQERVRFSRLKYGPPRDVDASRWPRWTGVVPDGALHALDFVEVLLVEAGDATLHTDQGRLRVRGPSIVLTRPDVARRVELADSLNLRLVVFPESAARRLGASRVLDGAACRVLRVPANPGLERMMAIGDSIEAELLAPSDDSLLMLDALLLQFLVILGRTRDVDRPARKPRLLARFEELLERRFRDEHRVRAYASALGVSADHLSEVVRGYDGGGAKAMVDERLMREARRLLATTDLRIAEVAERLGYDEPTHFTRAFRRSSGISPQRFRLRH